LSHVTIRRRGLSSQGHARAAGNDICGSELVTRRKAQSRESYCLAFFPTNLAALLLFPTMAGHSATMLSTSSSPFTQMGTWRQIASDRLEICSTTSRTSGHRTKTDALPLSARHFRERSQSTGRNFRQCLFGEPVLNGTDSALKKYHFAES
jgi:hypothetical protein